MPAGTSAAQARPQYSHTPPNSSRIRKDGGFGEASTPTMQHQAQSVQRRGTNAPHPRSQSSGDRSVSNAHLARSVSAGAALSAAAIAGGASTPKAAYARSASAMHVLNNNNTPRNTNKAASSQHLNKTPPLTTGGTKQRQQQLQQIQQLQQQQQQKSSTAASSTPPASHKMTRQYHGQTNNVARVFINDNDI